MLHLFSLPSNTPLAEKIRRLTDSNLAGIFGHTILNRAYDYLDAIESLDIQPGRAEAEILGSEPYEVTIDHRGGSVFGGCSCPYDGGVCKHLAALLMHLRDEDKVVDLEQINSPVTDTITTSKGKPPAFDFDQHLQGLSADELRALVRQFAPDSYRRSLAIQYASPETNQKALQSAAKKVRDLLKKVEQYGPDEFESVLLKRLGELRPFWLSDTTAVTEILQDCIEGIDEAQGEGYLYDGYSDGVFDGEDFGHYMAEFAAAQPVESMITVLKPLLKSFDGLEYGIASNFLPDLTTLLSETKRREIAPLFLNTEALVNLDDHQQRIVWQNIQPVLKVAEQRSFLDQLASNNYFVLELASLLEHEGEPEKAIEALENALPVVERSKTFTYFRFSGFTEKGKLFERRIELEQRFRQGRDLKRWATRYVRETASAESLHFATTQLPQQQKTFETMLQKANVEAFVQYLEDCKRLDEVVQLFQEKIGAPTHQTQYDFFKRHKKVYPKAAKTVFLQILATELPHAGDAHYRTVTEVLTHLKVVESSVEFQIRINTIKFEYKRRSNLMSMLYHAKL